MARPAPMFRRFVGHKARVDRLRRQLAGAKARNEPFPHCLFLGPSGVGKTLLARTLAGEHGTSLVKVMGYSDRPLLADKLGELKQGDYLFVDECHRLGSLEQELLMEEIDLLGVPNVAGGNISEGEMRISIPPWTLIGATDQPGKLLDALVKRFVITIELDLYELGELKEIVEEMATGLDLLVSPQAAKLIAEVSGGLPRQAEIHLKGLRLYYPDSEERKLGRPEVCEYLQSFEIAETGLGPLERRYLAVLDQMETASIESLARILGTDVVYLKRQVEAQLIRRAFVKIVPSGRQLTVKGQECLSVSVDQEIAPANIALISSSTSQMVAAPRQQARHGRP